MNIKISILSALLVLFIPFNGISQKIIEKNYFDSEKKLGGDITLKSSVVKTEGSKTFKIFEFESPDNGSYYLNVWLMGGELDSFGSGKFTEYELSVNNDKQNEKLKSEKTNWHNVGYKDGTSKEKKSLKLKKGLNQIVFSCDAPEIPEIEFIRLSKDKDKSEISETGYSQFVTEIKDEIQERFKNPKPKQDSITSQLKSGVVLSNPSGNYYHHIGVTFKYTTYKTYSFNSGQQVFFSSYAPDGYQHVLEVFSSSNPEAYSWVNKSNSSGLASLNISIPSTGTYYVRVRAWRQETQGLVDLNVNGQYYYSDCAVTGSGFAHAHETPTTYNYFTCHLSGDSRIWIEDNSGLPGKIRAFNDDYYGGGGDFYWGLASRVKKDFSVRIGAALISSYSSYNPTGTCDLYMMCQNSDIMSYFPNLEADDAIQSAPYSTTYNCISWSVGIDQYWSWPAGFGSDFSVVEDFYESYGYTSTGATSSNSVVDLWALDGSYTHASVRKPGNNHPHGYDWESKPGALMRTFHPRYSLAGGAYGEVVDYFIESSLKSTSLLAEKIAKGTDVIENIEFTSTEDKYIQEKVKSLDNKEILEEKYNAWKKTWTNPDVAIHSNPRKYAESEEYDEFIEYCKSEGEKVWPFLFEKFGQGQEEFMAINAIEDLTADTHKDLMQQVLEGNKLKSTTKSGAYIHRSPYSNTMKYIQAILKSTGEITNVEENGIMYSNSFDFNVYPNPATPLSQISFDLPYDATVSVWIIDMNGRTISTTINKQTLASGSYTYNLNIPDNAKGIYLVNFKVNNNYNVKRIVVE